MKQTRCVHVASSLSDGNSSLQPLSKHTSLHLLRLVFALVACWDQQQKMQWNSLFCHYLDSPCWWDISHNYKALCGWRGGYKPSINNQRIISPSDFHFQSPPGIPFCIVDNYITKYSRAYHFLTLYWLLRTLSGFILWLKNALIEFGGA